jgi:hypothetical protein
MLRRPLPGVATQNVAMTRVRAARGCSGLADEMSIRILAGTTTTHHWAMEKEAGASTA